MRDKELEIIKEGLKDMEDKMRNNNLYQILGTNNGEKADEMDFKR